MKRNKPTAQFWIVLGAVNVAALAYPINLLHRAETNDEDLFAAFAVIGVVFLLMLIDAVSIVVADLTGTSKR